MNIDNIKKQIADSAGNALYTYVAHWIIVNRLKKWLAVIKITQIVLTIISTGGFLTLILSKWPWVSWIGAFSSAFSLGINLYLLHFNMPNNIKSHTDAANELWDVREAYKSLLVDFDDLSLDQIRTKRDTLTARVSEINKKYPGTNNKTFAQAQKDINKYLFADGEAAQHLHMNKK